MGEEGILEEEAVESNLINSKLVKHTKVRYWISLITCWAEAKAPCEIVLQDSEIVSGG